MLVYCDDWRAINAIRADRRIRIIFTKSWCIYNRLEYFCRGLFLCFHKKSNIYWKYTSPHLPMLDIRLDLDIWLRLQRLEPMYDFHDAISAGLSSFSIFIKLALDLLSVGCSCAVLFWVSVTLLWVKGRTSARSVPLAWLIKRWKIGFSHASSTEMNPWWSLSNILCA